MVSVVASSWGGGKRVVGGDPAEAHINHRVGRLSFLLVGLYVCVFNQLCLHHSLSVCVCVRPLRGLVLGPSVSQPASLHTPH